MKHHANAGAQQIEILIGRENVLAIEQDLTLKPISATNRARKKIAVVGAGPAGRSGSRVATLALAHGGEATPIELRITVVRAIACVSGVVREAMPKVSVTARRIRSDAGVPRAARPS